MFAWTGDKAAGPLSLDDAGCLIVFSGDTAVRLGKGDWLIRDAAGNFSSCKQAVFSQTYEEIVLSEVPTHPKITCKPWEFLDWSGTVPADKSLVAGFQPKAVNHVPVSDTLTGGYLLGARSREPQRF